jgi:hypothetical protein
MLHVLVRYVSEDGLRFDPASLEFSFHGERP